MVDSPVVWVSTREVATRVAPLLTRHVDEQTRLLAAALVLDCLASSGVLAMTPAQPPLGLNLKDSPLARRYASDSPQECYSWHYDSRAALWLLEYAAHCPDVVAAVDARLYLDSATRVLSWSRFVVGLSPSGVAAAVEWRARNLPPAVLARDAPAAPGGNAHRHGGGPAPLSRAPLLLQVRQHMAADAMVQAPSHRAPWASMSAAPPTQMRSILHEEERAGRSRAAVPPHAQAAAVAPVLQRPHVPPRPVPGAAPSHPRAQSSATAAAPAVRVLQRSGQPMSWAQTVAAPPPAPSQSQPEHGAGAGDNISGPHAPRLLHAEARKSPMDTTGRVRCLSCGRQFSAYAHLQDHVDACHAGVNSADPGVVAAAAEAAKRDAGRTPGLPGGSKAKRSPLMLSDLLVRGPACCSAQLCSGRFACMRRGDGGGGGGNDVGNNPAPKTDTSDAGCTWQPSVLRGRTSLRCGAAVAGSCCQVSHTSVGGCLRGVCPSLWDGRGAHCGDSAGTGDSFTLMNRDLIPPHTAHAACNWAHGFCLLWRLTADMVPCRRICGPRRGVPPTRCCSTSRRRWPARLLAPRMPLLAAAPGLSPWASRHAPRRGAS